MSKADDPFKKLGKWIETLTKNENLELNQDIMKHIKEFCKQSPQNLFPVYRRLMTQLGKDNSKIRFIALLAINELFHRSSAFRALVERNMQELMELTLETNPAKLLPQPKIIADRLREKAKLYIKEWCEKYGDRMKRIKIAYSYLQNRSNPINTNNERGTRDIERREYLIAIKAAEMMSEMEAIECDILNTVHQIENCFELVVPRPDDLFSSIEAEEGMKQNDQGSDSGEEQLRHHGIINIQSNLCITIPRIPSVTVKQNADNMVVLENLNGLYVEIQHKYLPQVLRWLKFFSKAVNCDDSIKKAIDLKQLLEGVIQKYKEINFDFKVDLPNVSDSDSDHSDFEEVEEKEGFELEVKDDENLTEPSTSSSTPVVRSCSAPLPSGKLCPRQDRFKCPFHGVIIERDSCGNPIGINVDLNKPSTSQETIPDWQDPDLLADLEAQTGVNLHMPVKRCKKDTRTKVKKPKTTTYQRLCKKLFKKPKHR